MENGYVNFGDDFTATAKWTPKKYTVTFVNYDGSVISTNNDVLFDTTTSFTGTNPSRPDSTKLTYEFSGWQVNGEEIDLSTYKIQGDTRIIATYLSKTKESTGNDTVKVLINKAESSSLDEEKVTVEMTSNEETTLKDLMNGEVPTNTVETITQTQANAVKEASESSEYTLNTVYRINAILKDEDSVENADFKRLKII